MIDPDAPINWYQEAKSWQTAIGAAFGFLALFCGAWVKFSLDRRRDNHIRREELLSVAVALYSEILLIRQATALLARTVSGTYLREGTTRTEKSNFDIHFVQRHKAPDPILFKALSSKIGLLEPDIVLEITRFYTNFFEAFSYVPFLVDDPTRGYSYSPSLVLQPAHAAVNDVIPTLRRIENLANIRPPAEALDTGNAELVLEMEEEIYQSG